MIYAGVPTDFLSFRKTASSYLRQGISPQMLEWKEINFLLPLQMKEEPVLLNTFSIDKKTLRLFETASMYRADDIWELMYRVLFKIMQHGTRYIENFADAEVIELRRRIKEISRDIHKMHAFVRFQKMELSENKEEYFVAWHNPKHKILKAGASFFQKRFGSMCWTICTPDLSATWNREKLTFHEGVKANPFTDIQDGVESWWLEYYRSIFNPARIKIKAMKNEMPVHYWQSLPESKIITQLIEEAPERVARMQEAAVPKATTINPNSLDELRELCTHCTSCPIACLGGKAVFGEGNPHASIVVVGEQPGDEEDKVGKPFVGPSGKFLDECLLQAEIERSQIYITNAVKHFKWEARGKQRLHKNPSGLEILACKPWVEAELNHVQPNVIVCLGESAALSMLGIKRSIRECYREVFYGPNEIPTVVTYHPAYYLRCMDTKLQEQILTHMVTTLQQANAIAIAAAQRQEISAVTSTELTV